MNKQSLFTILLTVLMSMTGAKAFAHDIEVANDDGKTIYYNWANNNTELSVSYRGSSYSSYRNEYSDNVVIPESVVYNGNTYSVTSIGQGAFSGCSGLTSVKVMCSPTTLGSSIFSYCTSLKEVTFDCETATNLFSGYSSINHVNLSNSVISIGSSAFSGCSGLTSITIPNSVISIGSSAFSGCSGLTSITIPNSVTSIGYEAFSGCSGLTSVVIGSGVTSIGSSAFSNTNLRKTIWLTNTPPSGYNYAQATVNYVSNEQFSINNKVVYSFLSSYFDVDGVRYVPVSPSERTCDAIDCLYDESAENINIGETVTYKGVTLTVKKVNPYTCYENKFIKDVKISLNGDIGNDAFYGCTNMASAIISNQGTIGTYAFSNCSSMETAELGENVSSIGRDAFSSCSKLQSIVIPDAITSIGSSAFSGCSAMTSAQIGNGVETIYNHAFSSCSSMKQLKIGSKVKNINQYAFSRCSALPAITIPAAVTNINNYVFNGCTSLKEVNIADSDTELTLGSNGSSSIFSSCPLEKVYIGRNINYSTSSNYGYSPFYRNTSLKTVSITDKETEISENEFYGCTNLQSITIGDGVTTIGKYAFSGCSSLKYFAFGSQVQTIGQEAFSDCAAMVEVISKAQNPPVCGSQALDDINKFECKLYVPNGYMAVYQAADQWKDFFFKEEGEGTGGQGGGINYGKCEAPTITLTGNKLSFSCPTEGAVIHYSISTPDVQNGVGSQEVSLTNTFTVSVYATKEGYEDSEVTTAELISSSEQVRIGDTNGDGIITVSDVINLMDVILTTP